MAATLKCKQRHKFQQKKACINSQLVQAVHFHLIKGLKMKNHSNANLPIHQPATVAEHFAAMFARIDFHLVFMVSAFAINAAMALFITYTTYLYLKFDVWTAIPAIGWTFISVFYTLLVTVLPETWSWYAIVCAIGNYGLIQIL